MSEEQSDLNLLAACVLIGANRESVEERSGVLQYGASMTRDEANREALFREMRRRDKRYSRRFCENFFEAAGPTLEMELSNGWTRQQTTAELMRRMAVTINARV